MSNSRRLLALVPGHVTPKPQGFSDRVTLTPHHPPRQVQEPLEKFGSVAFHSLLPPGAGRRDVARFFYSLLGEEKAWKQQYFGLVHIKDLYGRIAWKLLVMDSVAPLW